MKKTNKAEITPENEAEILFPFVELVIKDETITVKEFSFLQGMKINAMAYPLVQSLSEFFNADADFNLMSSVFDQHADLLVELMAISTGKPVEWFNTLTDTEGQSLLMTFWSVNKAFFINRLLMKGVAQQQAPASPPSSPA